MQRLTLIHYSKNITTMSISNKDNKKEEKRWYSEGEVWLLQQLGIVQRLAMIGLLAQDETGYLNTTAVGIGLDHFFGQVEEAILLGHITPLE